MRRKLAALAAAGALGVAGISGPVLAGAVVVPAAAEVVQDDATTGSEERGLSSALAHRTERITEALAGLVSDGTITQEQADAVAGTLADSDAVGPHHGGGHHGGMGAMVGLQAAADALGLAEDEVMDALHDGRTLAELAEEQGVDVETLVDELTAGLEERIRTLVEEGIPGRHGGRGMHRDA